MAVTYKDAGVDIDAGNKAVQLMKASVRRTFRPEVLTDIGSFAGLFALDKNKYQQPVLLAGTDGVGTKLKIAMLCDKHDTIGIDAVAMCVNDILVQGAEPLFFLDYIAVGSLDPVKVATIVGGVAEGCMQSACALIGGETAEMPGLYQPDEYDIAGFAVGIAEKSKLLTGKDIVAGDLVFGLPSSGIHSNGFSLVRKIFFDHAKFSVDKYIDELSMPLGEALLVPTRIYVKQMLPVINAGLVKGMAHITGGGLLENIPRVLPEGVGVILNKNSWQVPPVFQLMQKLGDVPDDEMNRVFNMGIGLALIVAQTNADALKKVLPEAILIGETVAGSREVQVI